MRALWPHDRNRQNFSGVKMIKQELLKDAKRCAEILDHYCIWGEPCEFDPYFFTDQFAILIKAVFQHASIKVPTDEIAFDIKIDHEGFKLIQYFECSSKDVLVENDLVDFLIRALVFLEG